MPGGVLAICSEPLQVRDTDSTRRVCVCLYIRDKGCQLVSDVYVMGVSAKMCL